MPHSSKRALSEKKAKEDAIRHFLDVGLKNRHAIYRGFHFDEDFYVSAYMDALDASAGSDPYYHFITKGMIEKYHPNKNEYISERLEIRSGGGFGALSVPTAPVDEKLTKWSDRLDATINLLASDGVQVDIEAENIDFCLALYDYFDAKGETDKSFSIIQRVVLKFRDRYQVLRRYAKSLELRGVFLSAEGYYRECLSYCAAGEKVFVESKIIRCAKLLGEEADLQGSAVGRV